MFPISHMGFSILNLKKIKESALFLIYADGLGCFPRACQIICPRCLMCPAKNTSIASQMAQKHSRTGIQMPAWFCHLTQETLDQRHPQTACDVIATERLKQLPQSKVIGQWAAGSEHCGLAKMTFHPSLILMHTPTSRDVSINPPEVIISHFSAVEIICRELI